jgi:hypothetical protein
VSRVRRSCSLLFSLRSLVLATTGDGPGTFSQVRCRGTKRGVGRARRRSPCKAQRIANYFLPNRLFALAPIKRKVDGGDTMKDTWATEKGSQRTGVEMKVDAQGHKYSRMFSVAKDRRRRLRTKVITSRFRGEVQGQGYYTTLHTQLRATMETAFRAYGCGNTVPIRRPFGIFIKTTRSGSERQPEHIFARRERSALCTAHTRTEKEATPSPPTVKRRGRHITDQRKQMLREGHTCFSALRRVPLD